MLTIMLAAKEKEAAAMLDQTLKRLATGGGMTANVAKLLQKSLQACKRIDVFGRDFGDVECSGRYTRHAKCRNGFAGDAWEQDLRAMSVNRSSGRFLGTRVAGAFWEQDLWEIIGNKICGRFPRKGVA